MKRILPIITLLLTLIAAQTSSAVTGSVHHQLIIHATLYKIVTTGTVQNIVSAPVNNASIIKAVVAANTGLTPKELDIAIDDTSAEIDVIKKPVGTAAPTIVSTIAVQDSNTDTQAELFSTNPAKRLGYEAITGFLITLPSQPGPVRTQLLLKLGFSATDSSEFSRVNAEFFGGFDENQPDSYILKGEASGTAKTYTY